MTTQTIALYGGNLFGSNDHDLNQRQLGKIVNSGFTKVILFTLHVKSNGDLTYNDSPIVQNGTFSPSYTYLAALLQQLKTGIVDTNLQVHTVDNLYVAGSGVYPTTGQANPTLTIVALALRLADYLENEAPVRRKQ